MAKLGLKITKLGLYMAKLGAQNGQVGAQNDKIGAQNGQIGAQTALGVCQMITPPDSLPMNYQSILSCLDPTFEDKIFFRVGPWGYFGAPAGAP